MEGDSKPGGGGATNVEVRELETNQEIGACVDLQREIWGHEFADVVPASLLRASRKIGGIVAGAFVEAEPVLVGFVYGLAGRRKGRPVHWSHMLGVLPEFQSRGIGRKLKRFQRRAARESGVVEILWTFDPLIAGNANFNLNLLGVEVDSYEPDMYGETGSELHSFGTDRFVVRWPLGSEPESAPSISDKEEGTRERPVRDMAGKADRSPEEESTREGRGESHPPSGPVVNSLPEKQATFLRRDEPLSEARLRIAIPNDIVSLQRTDPSLARDWRLSTRTAFEHCLHEGYRVAAFQRNEDGDHSFYVLVRESLGEREDTSCD